VHKLATFAVVALLPIGVAGAEAAGPTDLQIAAIVIAANQVDIDAGKLAETKATSKEVKEFVHRMVVDHTGVNQSTTELVTRLHVTSEPNPTSLSFEDGRKQNLANLHKLGGASFDKAYVDHEVAYHEAVLDAIDKTLIPNGKNEELKALLVKARPAFTANLEHAKKLQASLK
jgi:putative membrane protein